MTEKITREQIEEIRKMAEDGMLYAPDEAERLLALCDLALQAEAMQPRPNACAFQVGPEWLATMVDKDIMAQGPTAEIAIERLHLVAKIEAEDTDHFAAIPESPVAKLFHVSLPEPRR